MLHVVLAKKWLDYIDNFQGQSESTVKSGAWPCDAMVKVRNRYGGQ